MNGSESVRPSREQLEERIRQLETTNAALVRRVERQGRELSGPLDVCAAACALESHVEARTHKLEDLQRMLLRTNQDLVQAVTDIETASRARADFLARVSHEIRTPMNGLIGMLDLVLDREESPQTVEDLMIARDSAAGLLSLLDDLLDYSKAEAQAIELEQLPVDLPDLVEDLVDLFAESAQRRGVWLGARLDLEAAVLVLADPKRLRQVLSNLINNAIKFTERGGVEVQLSMRLEGRECRVELAVEDSGIGVPAERQLEIFDPFSQADASTARRFGGTGLGLSISKQLVELMGGRLGLASEVARGSCFSFALQLEIAEGSAASGEQEQPLAGERVLLFGPADARELRCVEDKLRLVGATTLRVSDAEELARRLAEDAVAPCFVHGQMLEPQEGGLPGSVRERLGRRTRFALVSRHARDGELPAGLRRLELPLRRNRLAAVLKDHVPTKVEAPEARPEPAAGQIALVAEDNEINRMIAVRTIQKLGFQVETAENGKVAVEKVQSGDFDIVLMDCQMPEMDGYEATRRIRELGFDQERLPVIALTANAMEGTRERCLEAGMNEYLTKPFDLATLGSVLGSLLSSSS